MTVARPAALAVAVALAACKSSPGAGYDPQAASAFQRDTTAELGGDASPFSVVDAFYIGPGETLRLVRFERRVRAIHSEADDAVVVHVGEAFECTANCDGHDGAIASTTTVRYGPLALELAPQPVGDDMGGRVLVHDPDAPALAKYRAAKDRGLAWFPVSDAFVVAATFVEGDAAAIDLTTSRGLAKRFAAAGELKFELGGESRTLVAFRSEGAPASEPMLVPFTDTTNGESTYNVGRYLQVAVDGDGAVLDFNRATNPWCAYSPHYNCPVPPASNRLAIAVEAGEKNFPGAYP